jgi:hypothetical protein
MVTHEIYSSSLYIFFLRKGMLEYADSLDIARLQIDVAICKSRLQGVRQWGKWARKPKEKLVERGWKKLTLFDRAYEERRTRL